ncbi:condensation domain-containing protein [Streptomyces sp. CNQ085]|uniref:condensation domain-containing protein n=1 Tax=Streptomyces sp. CNQ085 TaxID=2886944 RepID=UPI001F510EBE|nr:condensation domain-containing protein [Streptomyces sp. CNQ085]MCI0383182.1 condensation domain-containing protein [Streptomyces sp. CNQ085]
MRIPLSFNQEFLCLFDQGDREGPFGPLYNIVGGWRLAGKVDPAALQDALDDVVARHEALRTIVVRDPEDRRQEILPPSPVSLTVREMPEPDRAARDRRAEELLIELEGGHYGVDRLPLLHAVLGRFDEDDTVLVLIAHHTAVDEVSLQVIIRDLGILYAKRCGHDLSELPEAVQFREFAAWERERYAPTAEVGARAYWRERLAGARITGVPTDHPKSAGLEKTTAVHRFLVGSEQTSAARALARQTRGSAFMVLLAAYKVFLNGLAGATDVVVPTMASGRGPARFQDTVGAFFNFVPLRTDLAGAATFREVVERTRATCLKAYGNPLPFSQVAAEAPELAASFGADDLGVVAFQVFQFPAREGMEAGDVRISEIRRRLLSQPVSTDVPDGVLFQLDIDPASGEMLGHLGYNTNLFREETMREFAAGFVRVLDRTVMAPDAPLSLV